MSQENRLRFLLLISGMVCFGWAKAVNAEQLELTNEKLSHPTCAQATPSIQIREVSVLINTAQ
jgi:hypothetical protein